MRCFRHFNLHEAEGTASAVYSLDLSPGGDALVCAAEDGDGEVLVDVASTSSEGGDA